jgi:hypothetical protein
MSAATRRQGLKKEKKPLNFGQYPKLNYIMLNIIKPYGILRNLNSAEYHWTWARTEIHGRQWKINNVLWTTELLQYGQGCQMVHLHTKKSYLGIVGEPLTRNVWYNLLQFGVHMYVVVIWCIFPPFGYVVPRKIWQPWKRISFYVIFELQHTCN